MIWVQRVRQWVWGHFMSGWATFLLVAMLVTTFGYSVDAAKWVSNSRPVIAALTWGLLLGALLARTRWKGWTAALYSLALSVPIIGNAIGSVLPDIGSLLDTPFLTTLDAGHLRLFTLQLRMSGGRLPCAPAGPSATPVCSSFCWRWWAGARRPGWPGGSSAAGRGCPDCCR